MKSAIKNVRIVDKDKGLKAMSAALRSLKGAKVKVGIFGEKAEAAHGDSGKSNVEIASYHEFGTERIPERSFVRATVDTEEKQIKDLQKRLAAQLTRGKLTEEQALNLLGHRVQALMVARVRSNIPPPLKPKTIERKGSSTALIDTGQLVQSITHAVIPAKKEG